MIRTLTISHGTSRGQDTYGYNIVRLRDSHDGKLYRCMGGGYDMIGTVLADWMVANYQDELSKLTDKAYYHYRNDKPYQRNDDGLYGMAVNLDTGRVSIDGACGVESVRRIAKEAGIKLTALPSRRGNTVGWVVGDVIAD